MTDKWITCGNPGDRVFVSDYEPGEIWLSVQVGRASAATVLTLKQAQEVIDALQAQIKEFDKVAA